MFVGLRCSLRSADASLPSVADSLGAALLVALAERYQVDVSDLGIAVTVSAIESVAISTMLMKSTFGPSSYLLLRETFMCSALAIVSAEDALRTVNAQSAHARSYV